MTAMVPEATTVLNKKPIMKVLVHKFGAEGNERSSIKDTLTAAVDGCWFSLVNRTVSKT